MNYKGYVFVENEVVISVHYYQSTLNTSVMDQHPSVHAIPEQLFNVITVGWNYVNGEFIQ